MKPEEWEDRNRMDARIATIELSELFRTMTDTHPDPASSPILRTIHRALAELEPTHESQT